MKFGQFNFLTGLDREFDSSKLPDGSVSLLVNGRLRRNAVSPIKKHLKIDSPNPTGNHQGLYVVGTTLVLFVNGFAYYRNYPTDVNWTLFPGWTQMAADVEIMYAVLVPISTNEFNMAGTTPEGFTSSFNSNIIRTPRCMLVLDGKGKRRKIYADGSWADVQEHALWTKDNPEFVPDGIKPVISGAKLYLISPDGALINHSVTNRMLDFVVNRTSSGDKGGTDGTFPKSVDYSPLTGLVPMPDGGLIASTLYATYGIVPDYDAAMFGEPYLRDQLLFPVGAVNERSWADVLGDTAFISQNGIQSFNFTSQTASESNNNPLSAKISDILTQPQNRTAAINYQTYALFAVDTIYGNVVLVYDTLRKSFVSLDTGFGEVKHFALMRNAGVERLFFLNYDGSIYEAYGADDYATCRVYVGDFSSQDAKLRHQLSEFQAVFAGVEDDTEVQLTYFGDWRKIDLATRTLQAADVPRVLPQPFPFPDAVDVKHVAFKPATNPAVFKSGFFVEWAGKADLIAVSADATEDTLGFVNIIGASSPTTIFCTLGDLNLGTIVADHGALTKVDVDSSKYYVISGTAHTGKHVYTDAIFRPAADSILMDGKLYECDNFYRNYQKAITQLPVYWLGLGDLLVPDGGADALAIARILVARVKGDLIPVPGEMDLSTGAGANFYGLVPSLPYRWLEIGDIGLMLINAGRTSAGVLVESHGVDTTSTQYKNLRAKCLASTCRFKLAVVHKPPYTDGAGSDVSELQWPFAEMGIQMVLSGHEYNYQRHIVSDTPYIIHGCMSQTSGVRNPLLNRASVFSNNTGYLRLIKDSYNLRVLFEDYNGAVHDAFAIHS